MTISVYILKCADDTFYTGMTNNITRRFDEHSRGRGSYTRTRRPVTIVFHREYKDRRTARYIEKQIKHDGARRWMATKALSEQHSNILSVI